jgi:hypothetical protein
VFEQMHYVCFHYEFEHDPVDPDEECGVGGCPSEAINPRPDRRPGPQPPQTDAVLAGGWISDSNLRRFLDLVSFYAGYSFDQSDWLAIEAGLEALAGETETFDYPIIGRQELGVSLSIDPNSDVLMVEITGRPDRLLGARIDGLVDAYEYPDRPLPS